MMPEIIGSPIPNKGIKMTLRRASLIIAAAVRGYNAGFCPVFSHVHKKLYNGLSGIKLSAHRVKQLQIFFYGQFSITSGKEKPRKVNAGCEGDYTCEY